MTKFNMSGLIEDYSTKKLEGEPLYAYVMIKEGKHDYSDGGRWVEPIYEDIEIIGVLSKLSNNDLKIAEAGTITVEDRKLRTYNKLAKNTPVKYKGEKYKIINGVDRSLYDTSGGDGGLNTYFITRIDK